MPRPEQDGLVSIYDREERSWFRRNPVDAREIVAVGGGRYCLEGPDGAGPPKPVEPKAEEDQEQVLGRMTHVQLREMCQGMGIKYTGQTTKSALVVKIMAEQEKRAREQIRAEAKPAAKPKAEAAGGDS